MRTSSGQSHCNGRPSKLMAAFCARSTFTFRVRYGFTTLAFSSLPLTKSHKPWNNCISSGRYTTDTSSQPLYGTALGVKPYPRALPIQTVMMVSRICSPLIFKCIQCSIRSNSSRNIDDTKDKFCIPQNRRVPFLIHTNFAPNPMYIALTK